MESEGHIIVQVGPVTYLGGLVILHRIYFLNELGFLKVERYVREL